MVQHHYDSEHGLEVVYVVEARADGRRHRTALNPLLAQEGAATAFFLFPAGGSSGGAGGAQLGGVEKGDGHGENYGRHGQGQGNDEEWDCVA